MPAIVSPRPEAHRTDLCAVVLAAGAGRRLRPLTRVLPKALCPVDGVPLVDHAVTRARTVTSDVAVNVHHGREQMEAHLRSLPVPVHISVEEDRPLGTAGALGHLRSWIDGRAVLVVNADTWAPGSLAPCVEGWDGESVRIIVAGEDRLRPSSQVVASLLPWPTVSVLEPVPSGLYEVVWRERASSGLLDVVRWDGPAYDCGTPARYLAANLAASGGHPVVGEGAVVEGTVERSVIWPGAHVHASEELVDAIRTDAASNITVLVR